MPLKGDLQGLGIPKITGAVFGGQYDKDCSILGSVLGSPSSEKSGRPMSHSSYCLNSVKGAT